MKLSNGDIYKAREPFQQLISLKLPVAVSYKLSKLANKLNDQLKVIEEVRQGLVRKYGTEEGVDANGPNFPKFMAEFNELMDMETEIVIDKIKLPEEVDGKSVAIEASVLMALEKFVDV